MKLILNQEDLDRAVCNYVTTLGMDLTGKDVSVDFTAGRGANGNTATVEILPGGTNETAITEGTTEPTPDEKEAAIKEDEETESEESSEDDDDSKSLFD